MSALRPSSSPPATPLGIQAPDRDAQFAATALPLLPTVARIARALAGNATDGDDLVQETFLRAYRYWHTFEPGSDCTAWLSTICRRALFDLRRREERTDVVDDTELESLAAASLHKTARSAGLEGVFDRVDLGPAIEAAIARLEPTFRAVVELADVEGFSYDEIAEMLDIPIGTVRSRLYRGRRHLQQELFAYALDAGYATLSPPEAR
jgi:RNA polymerase sigma-70 factor (ECF subfamily)